MNERPLAPFILSTIAGLFTLAGSGMMLAYTGFPSYGMTGGYYGVMRGYHSMMGGYGTNWFWAYSALGLGSGVAVVLGAVMLYNMPGSLQAWGAVILVFSILSPLVS